MSSAIKILPHYTYEDFCRWEGRWEIIEGIPYAMSPSPVPRHQWISSNFKAELRAAIKSKGCQQCKVYDFIDIKISDDTVLAPDGIVCCKEILKPFIDFPVNIVIEILSPATVMKDRNNKFYLYQSFKIPYYIIVDVDKNEVEIYHLDKDDKYQLATLSPEQPYTFLLEDDCSVDVLINKIWE